MSDVVTLSDPCPMCEAPRRADNGPYAAIVLHCECGEPRVLKATPTQALARRKRMVARARQKETHGPRR